MPRPTLPTPRALRRDAEAPHHHHHGLLTHGSVVSALISLAGLQGRTIRNQVGDEVGRVVDLVARWDGGSYPPATGLIAKVGRRPAYVPIAQVESIANDGVKLRSARLDLRDYQRRTGEVVLGRDVLDRQLVDVDGVRVVRASDLYLARVGLAWRLVGVDVSLQSLLRRLGPARYRSRATPERVLDWSTVQPFGSQPGELRLSRSSTALHRLRPAEVADLLEELGRDERQALLAALEPEVAADALEEMESDELEQLLRDAPRDQAAALVAAMEPDEAADALRDLEPDEREQLLDAMPEDTAGELATLLSFPEESAGGLMTTHLVILKVGMNMRDVKHVLRDDHEHRGDIASVLLVDGEGVLVDDVSLYDLVIAPDEALIDALARSQPPITVGPDAPLEEVVSRLVDNRSNSVVVVDADARPIGRILADDVIDALVPEKGRLRFPRILG